MDAAPDFEALRARRNAAVQDMHQKMADLKRGMLQATKQGAEDMHAALVKQLGGVL